MRLVEIGSGLVVHDAQGRQDGIAMQWRGALLLLLVVVAVTVSLSINRIPQGLAYHDFADQRSAERIRASMTFWLNGLVT